MRRNAQDMRGRGDPEHPELVIAVLGGLARGAVEVIEALDRLIPEARSAKYPVVAQVGYREVIRYFQEEQPNDFRIAGGALLRRRSANGVVLYQVFLDETDQIVVDEQGRPHGRAIQAREIDDELDHKFGRTDLIIFR
jgi:hypothetical protein